MKLPSKYIALLVILSLTGIFAYQAYWLTGLYRTMRTDLERNITEAMRISDYNEMLVRIQQMQRRNKEHGEISVSAGYGDEGEKIVQSNTTFHTSPGDTTTHTRVDTLYQSAPADTTTSDAMVHSQDGLDVLLRDHNSITSMAVYLQRGMHSGLDIFIEPSFATYDSLLNARLHEMNIPIRYRLQYLYSGYDAQDRWRYTDTLATGGTPGYVPGPNAVSYQYAFSSSEHDVYRLTTEPVGGLVLRQMAGILITSLVILLILGFSFWYLIHTILRQKTLEEMKSDFTNNITHELKTPIAVAYAATDALLNFHQADDPNKRERYLRICQEQLQRLGGLVEQILSMSMERRKTFRLHWEEVQLATLLPSLVELHKLKADKPVHITLDIVPEDLTVPADRTHLSNIVSNLLDNAVKYSRNQADITVRCNNHTATDGQVYTEICVSDHGIGIARDRLPHVFDKFYRVPTGNLHEVKGYGLGLFYVKTMVEKHGGTVEVKSEPGKGSEFKVRLRATKASPPAPLPRRGEEVGVSENEYL